MDSFLLLLANSIAAGVSSVAGTLIQKGVVDPALEPATNKLKQLTQGGLKAIERNEALMSAILTAIEDASGQEGESLAVQYAQKIRLHEIIEPSNDALRNEVMRLVYLASSADPSIIPDSLVNSLRLDESLRPSCANFLFQLRRKLNKLPDFKPLLEAAHQQTVETALKTMSFDLSALARTVEKTREGEVVRVRIVKDKWDAAPYLTYLARLCNLLPLAVIDPKYASPMNERMVTLSDVYITLNVESLIEVEIRAEKNHERLPHNWETVETHRMTVLEAIGNTKKSHHELLGHHPESAESAIVTAVDDSMKSRLVLLGEPGSGKSTFVNFLAYCLAMNLLEPDRKWLARLSHWSLGDQLPVRVILREWVAWIINQDNIQPNAQVMWDFIRHDLANHGLEDSFKPLREYLLSNGGIIFLDGLDEVPDANERREFLKTVIDDFALVTSKCHIIVTCRPYAYVKRDWKLRGFSEETIAPFSPEQIINFVQGWYNAAIKVLAMNPTDANSKATALIQACWLPYLNALAKSPLLLTLMVTLHTSRGKLPDDRADLYEDCVRLLLDYWQESKKVRVGNQTKIERGIIDELGISRDRLERALNQMAFEAHYQQGKQFKRGKDIADISGEDFRRILKPILGDSWDNAEKAIHYVRTRAGLLLEREPDRFVFPHRTFQEFLTARYLVNTQEFPFNLADWVRTDLEWWRDVFLLAVGYQHAIGRAVALIDALCNQKFIAGQTISVTKSDAIVLAAQAAIEAKLRDYTTQPGRYRDTLTKLQNWLAGIITHGALRLRDYAKVGRILDTLGDVRKDVSCAIPALVDVPAGEFIMGNKDSKYWDEKPQHLVMLKAYRIGKYPVTNAQYNYFVVNGGYKDAHCDCWTVEGLQWREKEKIYPLYPNIGPASQPIVGVSWHEAVAYCNWLTKTNPGRIFRLPTEAEWEKASRGNDGREYPWGNGFDRKKANTIESRIRQRTIVGLFPLGESPYHALDMAGNVWEWCHDWYGDDYYSKSNPENPTGPDSGKVRILRGGSWGGGADYARCANRLGVNPGKRFQEFGFRVAESLP